MAGQILDQSQVWPEESSAPKSGMFLSRLWPEGHRAASTSGDPGPSPEPRPCSESGMPGAGPFLTPLLCAVSQGGTAPSASGSRCLATPVPGAALTHPRLQGAVLCPGALCAQAPGDSRARRRGVTARAPPAGGQALAAQTSAARPPEIHRRQAVGGRAIGETQEPHTAMNLSKTTAAPGPA